MSILTNEEIVEQYQRAQEPEQMRYLLMLYETNKGLIVDVARKYMCYAEFDDLMQESFFGMKAAADAYDPDQGSFSTYAIIWLKQTMRRYIDNNQTAVRFPADVRQRVFKYRQILNRYIGKYGKAPTECEMMRLLQVSAEQYRKISKNNDMLRIRSTSEIISAEDESITLGDIIRDPEAEERFEEIIEIEDNKLLHDLLWDVDFLTDQEKDIIKKRYQDQRTLEDIGSETGATREKVRQIEARALRKYRRDQRIQKYKDDFVSARAYRGTGLFAFMNSGTSSTEKAALDLYEQEISRYTQQIEQEVSKISEASGIDLEAYKQLKIALFKDDLFARYEANYQ